MTDLLANPTAVVITSGMSKEMSRFVPEGNLVL